MTPWLFRLLALIVILGMLIAVALVAIIEREWPLAITFGIGVALDTLLIADLMERGE